MGRKQLLGIVGTLAIALVGCAAEETPPAAEAPAPSPVAASPTPNAVTAPAPGVTPKIMAQQPAAVPGLIPSTNIQERQQQVDTRIKGDTTKDPFAAVPPVLPKPDKGTVPDVSKLPPGSRPNNGAARPPEAPAKDVETPTIPKNQDAPLGFSLPPIPRFQAPTVGAGPSGGGSIPGAPPRVVLPPPPSSDTAKAVEVTGVVVVGGEPRAIVVAPGDATSRYVSVGQRLSGGKVLVKRIELGDGSEPIVILEENGVEVAKAVGEKPAIATNPNTSTAQ